ncbi:MAG: ATP-dependent Clp protease adaptor ClpS [Phycisphaerae bacterium]|nr:ATP-dependent Clp protease adaptor ClpS [Phycisphaerae bacterium]
MPNQPRASTPITPRAEAEPQPPAPQQPAPQAPSASGPAAAVAERPAPAKAPPRLDKLPPFRVLLHNDDHNTMEHVVVAIVQIASMPVRRAYQVMIEAHEKGLALVKVCHREQAELLQEQFQSKGLTATIEPAE